MRYDPYVREPTTDEHDVLRLARHNGGMLVRLPEGTWRGRESQLPRRAGEAVVLKLVRRGVFELLQVGQDEWEVRELAVPRGTRMLVYVAQEGERPRFRVASKAEKERARRKFGTKDQSSAD